MNNFITLQEYLKSEVCCLHDAKSFMEDFRHGDGYEKMKEIVGYSISERALAGHLSDLLEGHTEYNDSEYLVYFKTKYGSEIYSGV